MLNVLFFAQTRELIGEDSIQLEGDFATAEEVREHHYLHIGDSGVRNHLASIGG